MKMIPGLMALTLGVLLSGTAWGEGMEFPSLRPSLSPQKTFEITSAADPQQKGEFTLSLRNRKTGEQSEIFHGRRTCDVLWADDDSSVAITDWASGALSQVLVLKTSQKGAAKPLTADLARRFMARDELSGHCYWEALSWDPARQLRLRAFGHTDTRQSHQFAYEFMVDVARKSAVVVNQENGLDSKAEDRIWREKEKPSKH